MQDITMQVDLNARFQHIDGFGVNINPVGHWKNGALRQVLDQLIDDYGARLFRLDPYGSMMWIDPDNTGDHSCLSTEQLKAAYQRAPFRDAWETARYLNQRGIQPLLNVSGTVPAWMCGDDVQTLVDLEGYAELVTSLAVWAREQEGIDFRLFGPFNETDLGPPEGPFIGPPELAELSVLITERFADRGLADVGLVLADQAHYGLTYLQEILERQPLRQSMAVAAMHTYGDRDLSDVPALLLSQGLNTCRFWLTEYGDLDETGAAEWQVAVNSVRRLIRALCNGVEGAMVWDAYDNWHDHDRAWTIYGILRSARGSYTPKKRYFAGKQVSRYVAPGSVRVEATSSDPALDVVAFRDERGRITIVVLNETSLARRVTIELAGPMASGHCRVYRTDADRDCELHLAFPIGTELVIPVEASSITTLTSVE